MNVMKTFRNMTRHRVMIANLQRYVEHISQMRRYFGTFRKDQNKNLAKDKIKMVVDIYNTDKKYKTIYIDPPWNESGGGKIKRGADKHYPLMKTKDIAKIPIERLKDPEGCHIYLWTTNNFMLDAFELLKTWGFEYITLVTWNKDRIGLGQYFRGKTEHCIFGSTHKRLPYKVINGKRQQGETGFYEPKTIHSRKPVKMREMIERVSYEPRIEIFARQTFNGWDCWGNEVEQERSNIIE